MSTVTCSICIEEIRSPISLPCGHLHCQKCLMEYIESTDDAAKAACPSCRAAFDLVSLNLDYVPKKYHPYLQPVTRRIYLNTDDSGARETADKFKALEARVQIFREAEIRATARVRQLQHEANVAGAEIWRQQAEVLQTRKALAASQAQVSSLQHDLENATPLKWEYDALKARAQTLEKDLAWQNEARKTTQEMLLGRIRELEATLTLRDGGTAQEAARYALSLTVEMEPRPTGGVSGDSPTQAQLQSSLQAFETPAQDQQSSEARANRPVRSLPQRSFAAEQRSTSQAQPSPSETAGPSFLPSAYGAVPAAMPVPDISSTLWMYGNNTWQDSIPGNYPGFLALAQAAAGRSCPRAYELQAEGSAANSASHGVAATWPWSPPAPPSVADPTLT